MQATTKPLAAAAATSSGVVWSARSRLLLHVQRYKCACERACEVQRHQRLEGDTRRDSSEDATPVRLRLRHRPHGGLEVGHHHRTAKHARAERHDRGERRAVAKVEVPASARPPQPVRRTLLARQSRTSRQVGVLSTRSARRLLRQWRGSRCGAPSVAAAPASAAVVAGRLATGTAFLPQASQPDPERRLQTVGRRAAGRRVIFIRSNVARASVRHIRA